MTTKGSLESMYCASMLSDGFSPPFHLVLLHCNNSRKCKQHAPLEPLCWYRSSTHRTIPFMLNANKRCYNFLFQCLRCASTNDWPRLFCLPERGTLPTALFGRVIYVAQKENLFLWWPWSMTYNWWAWQQCACCKVYCWLIVWPWCPFWQPVPSSGCQGYWHDHWACQEFLPRMEE